MEEFLDRKFVLAFMPKCNSSLERKNFRCYVVIREFEMDLLVAELNYFVSGDKESLKLAPFEYPFLRDDSIINGYITLISKNDVLVWSQEYISENDFENMINRLRGINSIVMDKDIYQLFSLFCIKYYRDKIKVGSVLNVRIDGNLYLYYVKEKYEDGFLGVRLFYDPNSGLKATLEECFVSYDSKFENIFYGEEYKSRVLSLINNQY